MLVGVPKEIKNHEYRVGLTPEAAREYVDAGHRVIVETNAGIGISKTDDDYRAIGAEIVDTAEEVFARAEMVVKVKEPQPNEWVQLREGQILFTYLHLAPDPDQARGLMESGVSAVAYETVTAPDGSLPLLAPMSEVAGRLSIEAAAIASHAPQGGRGVLMGGVPGVLPAKVTVIGGGVVGFNAAQMAAGLGADVTILDRNPEVLEKVGIHFESRAKTRFSNLTNLHEAVSEADLVIGAVLLPGAFYTLHEKQTPPIQAFRDHGVSMAVATDWNPGSSPLGSLLLAMNMACTLFRMTPAEALAGTTCHAARALALIDCGVLAPGMRADLAIWDVTDPAALSYGIGINPLHRRIFGGHE